MSNSNTLPLLQLSLKLRIASLEVADMVKLPLPRFASSKGIASSLQGDFVVGINRDSRERAFPSTSLADAVCSG